MKERDLFDVLREGDPAAVSSHDEDIELQQNIKRRVLTATRQPVSAPRRRILIYALLAGMALAATAAAIYLTREPSDPRGIGCYQAPTLDAHQVIVDSPASLHPTECEPLWSDGTLTNPALSPNDQAPPLIGCVNDNGGLAVFPSDDAALCGRLGLASYVPPASDDVTDLHQRLLSLFSGGSCMSIVDAQIQVEGILQEYGFGDWSVTVGTPASDERPCASLSFDAEARTVLLVPIPDTNGEG